ncbi:MAG: butyrate kinase [Candidatus Latescibacteria bacterium]|nr:butyrate kinase [Candidatus Latescibacterota bacterium]
MKILVINPGGSSTKIAIFQIDSKIARFKYAKISKPANYKIKKVFEETIRHPIDELKKFRSVLDQFQFRKDLVVQAVAQENFDFVATRGGPLKPLPSGTYRVTHKVVSDIKTGKVQSLHPSLLGSLIGYEIAQARKVKAYFVDPESVDEFMPIARISGLPEISRKSLSHFLNTNAVVRKAAIKLNRKINQSNFIIAHLGSGITIAAKEKGKQIDANNANEDGPFSPSRTGCLPLPGVIEMCYNKKYSKQDMLDKIQRKGGLFAYLGTDNIPEIEKRIKNGDKKAELVYNAMIYQIAKEIGSMYVALKGKVSAIIITGGIAYQKNLVRRLKNWIKFLGALILVFPGEQEMSALAEGVVRVLLKIEKVKKY